jgi:hypothetical protein
MEQHAGPSFDAGPREIGPPRPIILSMHTTSPIRRYVLLRHGSRDVTSSRWSMERIAPAPHAGTHAPDAAPRSKPASPRS